MKQTGRIKFKKWLDNRGIKMSFAARKMDISYSHLLNWIAGRDGLSPEGGLKVMAFTAGEINMVDCILPEWEDIPLFVWGRGRMTLRELKKGAPKSKSLWEL